MRKRTMGDLRSTLFEVIDAVRAGTIKPDAAQAIVKVAAQVNNSLLAEIEANRLAIQQHRDGGPLGDLVLCETADPPLQIAQVPLATQAAPRQVVAVSPSPTPTALGRVIDRRPNGEKHDFGDPPPGRSALDQRKAVE